MTTRRFTLCALGPGDVCTSPANATNATLIPSAALGLVAGDDVDAIAWNFPPIPPPRPPFGTFSLLFSVAPGAAGPGLPGVPDPGAIYSSAGGGSAALSITSAALGLALGDDVDGFDESNTGSGGIILFSLATGSPSLGGVFSPGDIFSSVGGGFGLLIGAESPGCTRSGWRRAGA